MSKRPTVDGTVMISGQLYSVIHGPVRGTESWRIHVAALPFPEDRVGDVLLATSELWRGGKGPWTIADTTPFYPSGRRVELSELTPEDMAKITAPLPPSPDDYNLEDLDDDGRRIR